MNLHKGNWQIMMSAVKAGKMHFLEIVEKILENRIVVYFSTQVC